MKKIIFGIVGKQVECIEPEDFYQNVVKSMFNLQEQKRTGFFISSEGIGVTSLSGFTFYPKVSISQADSKTFQANLVRMQNCPSIGVLQNQKSENSFIQVANSEFNQGEIFYAAGLRDRHPYFKEVIVGNNQVKFQEDPNTNYILVTPKLPADCVGGPILNQEGKAVGIVVGGIFTYALVLPLSKLEKSAYGENDWFFVKA